MDVEELERQEQRKKKISVALLFLSALVVAGVFAWWMGAWGMGPSRTVYVRYDFAGGIDRGSPVRLAGIKVGKVSSVRFAPSEDGMLTLKLDLSKVAFEQLTVDSKFYINLAGLIGERYVEVVTGQGVRVEPGQTLQGVTPPRVDQLLSQGYGIFEDLRVLLESNKGSIKETIDSLNLLTVQLSSLFDNSTPAQRKKFNRFLDDVVAIAADLRGVSSQLSRGMSYMHKNQAAQNWQNMTELLSRAEGTQWDDIRRLLMEDGVKVNFSRTQVEER